MSGKGFDVLLAGPNATNVPNEAIIVDNSNPDVVSMWMSSDDIKCYGSSFSYTANAGASLSFSFDGVAIWYDCIYYT